MLHIINRPPPNVRRTQRVGRFPSNDRQHAAQAIREPPLYVLQSVPKRQMVAIGNYLKAVVWPVDSNSASSTHCLRIGRPTTNPLGHRTTQTSWFNQTVYAHFAQTHIA